MVPAAARDAAVAADVGWDERHRIDLAMAENTAQQLDRTFIPQIFAIALVAALFQQRLGSSVIWWWAAVSTINLALNVVFNGWRKRELRRGTTRGLPAVLNVVFSMLFGLMWGSLVVIAERFGEIQDRSLAIVIALAAMSLSAVVTAGLRSMYLAGMGTNMVVIAVGFASVGQLNPMFAALILLYFSLAAFLHDTLHRMLRSTTESMFRNEILAARLEVALAFEDPMTGLRNRDGLTAWVDELTTAWPDRSAVVAVGNVDRLSAINELFGAEHGDRVLATIGHRLADLSGSTVVAGRLAGDEFALVEVVTERDASRVTHPTSVSSLERRLQDVVREPIEIEGQLVDVSMTTAVEIGPSIDFDQLVIGAAAAVRAERARRVPSLLTTHGALGERRELIDDLRVSLGDGSLRPWFQPLVDCETHEVVGWEALARWQHPTRGLVPPLDFLGLVELGRLSTPFTDRIIDDSIRFVAELIELGREQSATVHVNLSACQARRSDIVAMILGTLAERRVSPTFLVIEITEQDVPQFDDILVGNLRELAERGVGVSIDDFGTGYSSLSHLFDIRPTELKIDKRFIDGVPGDPTSVGLVRGVLGLARGMGLSTVAEGVETQDQADFLRANDCGSFQGYLMSPALPPDDALTYLAGSRLSPAAS